MTATREALLAEVAAPETPPPDTGLARLLDALLARCDRAAVQAVLVYGSDLWTGPRSEGVLDLYLLVDHPRAAGQGRAAALLNRLLPPNVVYLQVPGPDGGTLRAKCAIVGARAFARAARGRACTPLIWARFAQPCRLVHVRDADAAARVRAALADAVVTFHRKLLPLLPARLPVAEVWRRGLRETYARELRSEGPQRAAALWRASAPRLQRRTELALPLVGWPAELTAAAEVVADIPPARRRAARLAAMAARPAGKAASLLRLIKAAFTFDGGVDYLCWKIERHSGVRVEPTAFQRRHPLLAGWPLVWRIYRAGGFR